MDGPALLRAWIESRGLKYSEFARSFGSSKASVSQWIADDACRPDRATAVALELATGIPATAWLTPEELERVNRAAALTGKPAHAPDTAQGATVVQDSTAICSDVSGTEH